MLAFSGCYYGGGDKEIKELGAIRKRWKTLHVSFVHPCVSFDMLWLRYVIEMRGTCKNKINDACLMFIALSFSELPGMSINLQITNPDRARRQGKCPLTPEELGLILRALGYGSDVHIYVASGEIYGGEETLAPLKALFPNFHTKETLASKKELEPFSSFSSRMAALDFIVCDESDVFVTNNNGNMARILAGRRYAECGHLCFVVSRCVLCPHLSSSSLQGLNSFCCYCRRYFGHKPTIRPNAKKLYRLFSAKASMTWEAFASKVRSYQRGFMGEPMEVRPGRGEFHENPSSCICEDSEAKAKRDSRPRKLGKGKDTPAKDEDVIADDQNINEDPEWSDLDDEDNGDALQESSLFNGTLLDYDAASEEPELEDILSD